MSPKNPINAISSINPILDALALQQHQGETSLIVRLAPTLIEEAMNVLRDYRKLFVPVIPGETDIAPIYETYERMRQVNPNQHTILLLVECQTIEEFRQALLRMPIRKSSEWRSLDNGDWNFMI